MEPNEAPLSTSPSSSNFSPQRHFYLAVDRLQFKMETMVDLLNMAGRFRSLPIVVSCSTRDELDAVCSALSSLSHITIDALYSDLLEVERARVLTRFRQATMRWNKQAIAEHGDAGETEKEEEKSHLIVVTDSPISARVLINYELPTKKETYVRRMATCLAADGIVINMVVGSEVVTLRNLEGSSGLLIEEMPINIFEML
ncbi:unnamed protein product [Withania somnifera]